MRFPQIDFFKALQISQEVWRKGTFVGQEVVLSTTLDFYVAGKGQFERFCSFLKICFHNNKFFLLQHEYISTVFSKHKSCTQHSSLDLYHAEKWSTSRNLLFEPRETKSLTHIVIREVITSSLTYAEKHINLWVLSIKIQLHCSSDYGHVDLDCQFINSLHCSCKLG